MHFFLFSKVSIVFCLLNTYLVYLGDESESLHCRQSQRSSSLLCSSQLNVLGETVPVRSWLEMQKADLQRLHLLPSSSPGNTTFLEAMSGEVCVNPSQIDMLTDKGQDCWWI